MIGRIRAAQDRKRKRLSGVLRSREFRISRSCRIEVTMTHSVCSAISQDGGKRRSAITAVNVREASFVWPTPQCCLPLLVTPDGCQHRLRSTEAAGLRANGLQRVSRPIRHARNRVNVHRTKNGAGPHSPGLFLTPSRSICPRRGGRLRCSPRTIKTGPPFAILSIPV